MDRRRFVSVNPFHVRNIPEENNQSSPKPGVRCTLSLRLIFCALPLRLEFLGFRDAQELYYMPLLLCLHSGHLTCKHRYCMALRCIVRMMLHSVTIDHYMLRRSDPYRGPLMFYLYNFGGGSPQGQTLKGTSPQGHFCASLT